MQACSEPSRRSSEVTPAASALTARPGAADDADWDEKERGFIYDEA
jgi:hypothetical protein